MLAFVLAIAEQAVVVLFVSVVTEALFWEVIFFSSHPGELG